MFNNISYKDLTNHTFLSPKCILCNRPITFQDRIYDNYYCTLPDKKFYSMIYTHKTCVLKNFKGGC